MISKFEKFIKSSGFKATWVIYYILFQIFLSLFLVLLLNVLQNSNFDLEEFYNKFLQVSTGIFLLIFLIFVLKDKGISKILTSIF